MTHKHRKGLLKLEGSEPMSFVESVEGPTTDWTQEQEAASHVVSDVIRIYLRTVESLTSSKYAHLENKIPEYMAHPGNVLIAICTDGIVIRYERKLHEERKLVVSVIEAGISDAASLLSQRLVHVQSPEQPSSIDDNFGVELKLAVHSPSDGISRDLVGSTNLVSSH